MGGRAIIIWPSQSGTFQVFATAAAAYGSAVVTSGLGANSDPGLLLALLRQPSLTSPSSASNPLPLTSVPSATITTGTAPSPYNGAVQPGSMYNEAGQSNSPYTGAVHTGSQRYVADHPISPLYEDVPSPPPATSTFVVGEVRRIEALQQQHGQQQPGREGQAPFHYTQQQPGRGQQVPFHYSQQSQGQGSQLPGQEQGHLHPQLQQEQVRPLQGQGQEQEQGQGALYRQRLQQQVQALLSAGGGGGASPSQPPPLPMGHRNKPSSPPPPAVGRYEPGGTLSASAQLYGAMLRAGSFNSAAAASVAGAMGGGGGYSSGTSAESVATEDVLRRNMLSGGGMDYGSSSSGSD